MAITDPRVVNFSNANVRRFGDLLYSAYMTAKSLIAIWNAQGLSALTPNTSAIVEDGASINGTDATNAGTLNSPWDIASALPAKRAGCGF